MKSAYPAKNSLLKRLKSKMLQVALKTKSRHVHIGSCLSCFEIIFETLIYQMRRQDKFILSKGHAALSLYTVLNYLQKIPNHSLTNYLRDKTDLGIHPSSSFSKDIPLATGSLGHGLSFACGLSKGYILANKKPLPKVYCLLSDGECNEGSVWEAALFASQHQLKNLIVIIDKNNLQAFGKTKEVLGEAVSAEKWQAFGFNVLECNGHNISELESAFQKIKKLNSTKPNLIITDTIRGHGIASIEGKVDSNYLPVSKKDYKQALKTINNRDSYIAKTIFCSKNIFAISLTSNDNLALL